MFAAWRYQIISPHDTGIATCISENTAPWEAYDVDSVTSHPNCHVPDLGVRVCGCVAVWQPPQRCVVGFPASSTVGRVAPHRTSTCPRLSHACAATRALTPPWSCPLCTPPCTESATPGSSGCSRPSTWRHPSRSPPKSRRTPPSPPCRCPTQRKARSVGTRCAVPGVAACLSVGRPGCTGGVGAGDENRG